MGMSREEAIKQLKYNRVLCINSETEPFAIAYDMAIKALEQESKPMVEIDLYSVIKQKYIERDVLDKLRAEIAEYGSIIVSYAITKDTKTDKGIEKLVSGVLKEAKEQVLEIIDKYRAESEK